VIQLQIGGINFLKQRYEVQCCPGTLSFPGVSPGYNCYNAYLPLRLSFGLLKPFRKLSHQFLENVINWRIIRKWQKGILCYGSAASKTESSLHRRGGKLRFWWVYKTLEDELNRISKPVEGLLTGATVICCAHDGQLDIVFLLMKCWKLCDILFIDILVY